MASAWEQYQIKKQQYSIEDARADLEKSTAGLIAFIDGAYNLFQYQGWKLLGYESWDALCAREYRYKIKNRIARLEAVETLANRGMSTVAIAAAVGYAQSTIARDVQALTQLGRVAPDRTVVGLNNQEYPQEIEQLPVHIAAVAAEEYPQDEERAEQVIQLVKDQAPSPPRLECEIGGDRISKKLARIHQLLDDLDWENNVTRTFLDHLKEVEEHAARVRGHYQTVEGYSTVARTAPWPSGSTKYTTLDKDTDGER
jgi:hypothetical protein